MADWSPEELQLIVSDYMEMLGLELQGKRYSKAEYRRKLIPKLADRSEGSIEFKHQNISAVLKEAGLQRIRGYKPASNYQSALKVVVLEAVQNQPLPIPPSEEGIDRIPDGITRAHLLQAIKDFENGVEHRFGPSSTYDVLHKGKRYPPKAIVGLAAKHILGSHLQPEDFGGGLETKCFRVLESNGFRIVRKKDSTPRPLTREELIEDLNRLEGDPSGTAETRTRTEQELFRRYLLGIKEEAECSICDQIFKPDLLITAHIKKRADCTVEEKKNPDVVMLACKFGCDDLYEKHYIFVNEYGVLCRDRSKPTTEAMNTLIDRLNGKQCNIWSLKNKQFFDAHRELNKQ
jgi:hypothetical protein